MKNNEITNIKLTKACYFTILIVVNLLFMNTAICGLFGGKSTKIKGAIKEGEGIVIVQFVNNSRVQSGLSNWDEVILENIKTKKTFKLLPIHNNGLMASIVFAGALKEGRYKLTGIKEVSEYATGGVTTVVNHKPISSILGKFNIIKESITDLGTIILYPIYVKSDNGNIGRKLISINTNEKNHLIPFLRELHKEAYESANKQSINGWDEGLSKQNRIILEKIYLHGLPFKYQQLTDNNTLVIFHKLGGITFIEEGKPPLEIHTGYYSNFKSYVKTPTGHLLAGENGLTLYSSKLRGPWKRVDILGVIHNVIDLYYESESLIAISSYDEYPCPENLSCKGPNKLSIDLKNLSYKVISTNDNDINYSNLPNTFHLAPSQNFVFGQKLEYKLKNGALINYNTGTIFSPNAKKHKISLDNGKSWEAIKTNLNSKFFINGYNTDRPIYVNKDAMVYTVASVKIKSSNKKLHTRKAKAKRAERVRRAKFEMAKVHLYKMPITDINTNTDKYVISGLDPYCSRLIPDISSDNTIYISCLNGDLINTTDDGKTWNIVYENQ